MSVIQLAVPDIGDFKDIPVIDVLVKPGDSIKKEDPLITLESEKATMDVPATHAGKVESVSVKPGDKVSKGTPILTISVEAPEPAAASPVKAPPAAAASHSAPSAPPPAAPQQPQVLQAAPAANGLSRGDGVSHGEVVSAEAAVEGERLHASPAIRRFARELGVALDRVSGTGPNGRITRDDIQGFVKRSLGNGGATISASGVAVAPLPRIDFSQFGPIEARPLTRIQRLSGPNLHRNWVTIPHVTSCDDADVTELESFRKELNGEQSDVKVTMLAFLIKAAVATLKEFPNFNASLDGEQMILKRYYHIGFAADTPDGLVVPVIREADRKGIFEIASETSDLASKARAGKLTLSQMQGSSFTISSLGGIGGTYFT